jgi:hypothetical protein
MAKGKEKPNEPRELSPGFIKKSSRNKGPFSQPRKAPAALTLELTQSACPERSQRIGLAGAGAIWWNRSTLVAVIHE